MGLWDQLVDEVEVKEVGTRDGFQMETEFIPTDIKVELINKLSQTGIKAIQVTSAVHPKAVPQLRDAEEVMARIDRQPGVSYSVLVPNLRGAERAVEMKADEWELMQSVTESHSRSNANHSVDETLQGHEPVVQLAKQHGVNVRGGMATALGCPFEGNVPFERVLYVAEAYYSMGIRTISVADTVGVAAPRLVYETMSKLKSRFPDVKFNLHVHNTRGMALANILAGMQAGVRSFDAAIGGLGGCLYAPDATGNVATEDLVHMLHLMGIKTGVDFDALMAVTPEVERIVNHSLESAVYKAGPSSRLYPAPSKQVKKVQ
ncbi:hydroxymethylglutaryl-CoA lyase [Ammoniphilus resinae]|uniref:Hydroxymethylglutaryl-CoA lyase n=1 Tax=Ammoniphilus resinae TaxID=861532 RepID=A0ABS4GM33_9BACL|nr:hydroxymethylglutaryl-CoA lyase [Ammoniphilus resinae]MBP1931304.1 hydroxymethylglutaryl-CoA lyase [Ammoniphilus resinae]